MRSTPVLRIATVALVMLAAPRVRADQISWSYDFSLSTDSVHSNADPSESGRVVFSPLAGTLTGSLPTSATITAVNLEAFSKASAQDPARFSHAEYTLVMRLTDLSSGLSAALTFVGELNGTVSAAGTSLTNQFLGQKQYAFDLNHHVYTISIGDFTAPGAPGSGDLGDIGVNVSVHHNPEPSSLLLAAVGLPAVALLRRRR